MNYWLVRADWNKEGSQIDRLIQDNIWENEYIDKYQNSVNGIKVGDRLFLANKSDIIYSALCSKNYRNGRKVEVEEWLEFDTPIYFQNKGTYSKTITRFESEKMLLKVLIEFSKRKLSKAFVEVLNIEKESPTYLNAIKIKEYFSIKDMEIDDLKAKKEIYFVGANGDGKTILLQAILLALKKNYSGFVTEHIKNIKNDMNLYVKDEFSMEYNKNFNIKNVFAYGINRNKVHYKDYDKFGYGGLFDTSDSRRTTYLKDPFYELDKKYMGNDPLIKEFIEKLNTIILKNDYRIFDGGDVDFNELSEGYKSTIIWLYDLTSRLIENQQEIEKKVEKLEDFKAIVLIDEIDLYLHPKWKYDFVHNLRKVFPNIQWIMITHSTATILGAREDAVFYKVYKEDNETKISHPMDNIKNLMANNLSTSPLFDMSTARARNSDKNIDTSEDFIYTKIHQSIAQRVQGKKAIIEDDIVNMIDKELDEFLKENNL